MVAQPRQINFMQIAVAEQLALVEFAPTHQNPRLAFGAISLRML